jgi:hypothetical protein
MPRVPTLDAPSVVNSTTSGQRFSTPQIADPVAPNGARFNTQPQDIRVDTSRVRSAQGLSDTLGDGLNKMAGIAMKAQMDAVEQANQVKINDALNKATQARLALTYDPQQGYVHLQGNAAIERPDKRSLDAEYTERFADSIAKIEEGLGNDKQRAIFREKAGGLMVQFQGGIVQHVAKEYASHAIGVQEGTIATNIGRMALEYGNPEAVIDSMNAIKAATAQEGKLRGWSAKQVEAATVENLSRGHSAVIQSTIDQMPDYAKTYFDIHKAEFTPQARLAAQRLVDEGAFETKTQDASDSLWDKHGGDMKAIMGEVRQKFDGKERDAIETRLTARNTKERQIEKQYEDDVMEKALDAMSKGQRIPASLMAQLSGRDRLSVQNTLRSMAAANGPAARKTDMRTWLAFADMSKEDKAKMSMADLYRMAGPGMSDADLKSAAKEVQQAREAMSKGEPPGLQLMTITEVVKQEARSLGIIPPNPQSKLDGDQEQALARFRNDLQSRIVNHEKSTGKTAGPNDILAITQQMKVDTVRVRGRMFGESEPVPVVSLNPAQQERAQVTVKAADGKGIETIRLGTVPSAFRLEYANRARARGVAVREADIAQAWVRAGKPKD